MKKLIVVGIMLLTGSTTTYSQNCTGTHSLYCNPYLGKDKEQRKAEEQALWTTTTQSKSGAFVQGDTVDVKIVVQKDQKYRITVCSADEALEGKVQMMIVETETKVAYKDKKVTRPKTDADGYPVMDTTSGEPVAVMETVMEKERYYIKKERELYDNSSDNNAQTYIFTTDRTRKLTVRIITPVVSGGGKKTKGLGTEAVSCVGILIEHAKGPATGVNKAR